jgi:hypothetical protein
MVSNDYLRNRKVAIDRMTASGERQLPAKSGRSKDV